MRNVIRRLDEAIEEASANKDPKLYRRLVVIRYGSVYGSKHNATEALKEFYLGGKNDKDL